MSAFSDGVAARAGGEFEKAAEIWQPLADAGDPQAQYMLCLLLQDHLDRKVDAALIAREIEASAESGDSRAQYFLSLMYRFGKGVPQDPSKSIDWLKRSANQGEESAKYRLSAMYRDGIGVDKDEEKAQQWLQGLGSGSAANSDAIATDAAE